VNEELGGYSASEEYEQTEGQGFETVLNRPFQLPLISRPRGEAGSGVNLCFHCEIILAKVSYSGTTIPQPDDQKCLCGF